MHISRRIFQIYPVALTITLAVASHAKAQLCLPTAEHSSQPKLTEQTSIALAQTDVVGRDWSEKPAVLLPQLEAPPARSVVVVGVPGSALAQPVVAQDKTAAPNRAQGETIRNLMLVFSQPMLAEVGLQPAFAD